MTQQPQRNVFVGVQTLMPNRNRNWLKSKRPTVPEPSKSKIALKFGLNFEHDAILNDGVRFAHFVDVAGRLQIHRARVDAFIDSQQRHANALMIAIDQGPETTMGVAILRADTRMQHKRASGRRVEHFRLQQELAARQQQIGLQRHPTALGHVRTTSFLIIRFVAVSFCCPTCAESITFAGGDDYFWPVRVSKGSPTTWRSVVVVGRLVAVKDVSTGAPAGA
jgi:hypothetical protein